MTSKLGCNDFIFTIVYSLMKQRVEFDVTVIKKVYDKQRLEHISTTKLFHDTYHIRKLRWVCYCIYSYGRTIRQSESTVKLVYQIYIFMKVMSFF